MKRSVLLRLLMLPMNRKIRSICSAAEPEMLYTEGEGSEFGRTASRLREMQSKTWLSAS